MGDFNGQVGKELQDSSEKQWVAILLIIEPTQMVKE